jgi:hypothetical protein
LPHHYRARKAVERSKSKPPLPDKPPETESSPGAVEKTTGRVKFDDRGNAIWEWSISTGSFGLDVSSGRLKKLEHGSLSIADESSPALSPVKPNPVGAKKGYNPYDSVRVGKPAADKPGEKRKKKDLRRLGEWIALRKQASAKKDDKT